MRIDTLNFGPGKGNKTGDFICRSNRFFRSWNNLDLLMFADSRGNYLEALEKSWTNRLFKEVTDRKMSGLLIVRPRDCTVFFTLLNFLVLNDVRARFAIFQLGLVDFTPKKNEVIADIMAQQHEVCSEMKFGRELFSKFLLSDGTMELLLSVKFNTAAFRKKVVREVSARFEKVFFIGNLEMDSSLSFPRPRPKEFFRQLCESNRFVRELVGMDERFQFVDIFKDISKDPFAVTFDGVHYTEQAHEQAARSIKDVLKAAGVC